MKILKISLFLITGISILGFVLPFIYKPIPENYKKNKFNISKFQNTQNKILKVAYDLTNSLPKNFVTDGTVDYTLEIQKAINENRNIVFPNFPILINQSGLTLRSNTNLIFKTKSQLLMKANYLEHYEIIRIHNVKNITIFKPNIKGDRNSHTGANGEWGMGIAIRGSSNIKIINPIVSNCWGDGIYIGQKDKNSSLDITIYNGFLDNNRRNGITITSGKRINLYHPVIANTNGIDPMYGIDVEPNTNDDDIENVVIQNAITYNNAGGGISIGLNKLLGKKQKKVIIDINNFTDEFSKIALNIGGITDVEHKKGLAIKGKINIKNPKWISNYTPFKSHSSHGRAPLLEIINPTIINPYRVKFTVEELKKNKSIIVK